MLGIYERLWRTSRQVRWLCPWARHLTGRPTFVWMTGDPEMATPTRVRTYGPKHSDTSLSRDWRIDMANKKIFNGNYLQDCIFLKKRASYKVATVR